jgi:hypothetical protein
MRGLGRLTCAGATLLACAAACAAAEDRPPAVRIAKMTVDGRTGSLGDIYPPGRGNIEIEYALVDPAERVQFRYRLEGFDRAWIDAGDRRRAYYTGVPAGRYRFVVEAGRDGAWTGTTAAASIHLRPPFYRTLPFYVMAVAAVLTVIIGAWALSERRHP